MIVNNPVINVHLFLNDKLFLLLIQLSLIFMKFSSLLCFFIISLQSLHKY